MGPCGKREQKHLENCDFGEELDPNLAQSPRRIELPPPFDSLENHIQQITLFMDHLGRVLRGDIKHSLAS